MKNKTTKILSIISIIIFVLGVLWWVGTDNLISTTTNSSDAAIVLSYVETITLRILIISITFGMVALIWLIYGIIFYIKKNSNKFSKKTLIIIIILIIIIMTVISTLSRLLTI